ncbi:major facilitator superfamily MFS_1 [Terriglobus saanensis SP1PR4]|uniref:Major facilitator superfamily MFS_1 n=1 Tax=Terriglobus saanensis (strain ATCC BAA-1853 / DSM 23119 / SP1PR4) TaxID=401053 RepID=E8V3G6_TERSS|nr:major facilitator superfamily MFS_1 [Terriglobus saanensis SP1PR4]
MSINLAEIRSEPARIPISTKEEQLRQRTMKKVSAHLIPFMIAMFCANFLDRVNISFAALQMNHDLHLTPQIYGFAAGILFVAYTGLEVPSNLILQRVGARIWLSRIMITWGIIAAANAFIFDKHSLYAGRLLLGAAEAGFFPGIMLYLVRWFPARERAAAITIFMIGNPIAIIFGAPLSTTLLSFGNMLGFAAWRWLFFLEGLPSMVLGILAIWWLTDRPEEAKWLAPDERAWLASILRSESKERECVSPATASAVFLHGPTLAFAASKFCVLLSFYGIALWLPQIVKSIGHLTTLQTGFVSAIPYLCAAVGSIYVGRRSDRTGERPRHIAFPAFFGAAGFILAAYSGNAFLAMAGLCIAATGIWCSNTIFWTMPAATLSGASAAAGFALINSVGNLGGFFGPYMTGWVRGATGNYALTLVFLGGFLALSGVIVLMIGRSNRRKNDLTALRQA